MSYEQSNNREETMESWLQVEVGMSKETDDDDEGSYRFLPADISPAPIPARSPCFREISIDNSYIQPLSAQGGSEGKWRGSDVGSSSGATFSFGSSTTKMSPLPSALERMAPEDAWVSVANVTVGQGRGIGRCGTKTPVELYEHKSTGLRVCFVGSHGPLVRSYFCIATESVSTDDWQKDDGIPHILEHLTTFGCTNWPYRNVLDQLACRCVSQQTDAWTETDHSAYVLKTLGEESFFTLLPIYMDHILEPLLKEEAFKSEVCHVNHKGENSGLIFEEVKSRESSCEEMCLSTLLQNLFPDENSGYSSMPSGRSNNIRHLKIESVRKFHTHFYTPQNMQIVVSGSVDKQKVLDELHRHSISYFKKRRVMAEDITTKFERPWSRPLSHPSKSGTVIVDFPVEKVVTNDGGEPCGIVLIGWRGPPWSSFEDILKIRLMWKYLINSPSSPLKKLFLTEEEISGQQLCKHISVVFTPQSICCHHVRFYDVPISLLHVISPIFFHAIAVICNATSRNPNVGVDQTGRTRFNKISESSSVPGNSPLSQNLRLDRSSMSPDPFEIEGEKKDLVPSEISSHLMPTPTFFSKLCARERRRIHAGCVDSGITSGPGPLEEACRRNEVDDSFGTRECHIIQRLRAIEATILRDKGFNEGVDMKQMSTVIVQEKLRQKMIWEDDRVHSNVQTPHLIGKIISQFLYGDRSCHAVEMQQLDDFLNNHEMLNRMPQTCDDDSKLAWHKVMFDHLLRSQDPNSGGPVCVIGRPSSDAFQQQVRQEIMRVEENREVYDLQHEVLTLQAACEYLASEHLFLPIETLYQMPLHSPAGATYYPLVSIRSTPTIFKSMGCGVEGVNECTSIDLLVKGTPLDVEDENESTLQNETSAGDEMLAFFYSRGLVQEAGRGPLNPQLPFVIQWSQIPSHFLDICVAIETTHLPAHLRPYLQLFTEILLELPVRLDDGSRLRSADVKELRGKDVISTYCRLGIGGNLLACGEFAQAVVLTFRVEQEHYEQGVEWLRRTLFHADIAFETRIIQQACQQIMKAVSTCQSDGLSLCTQLIQGELFDKEKCNHCASSILDQNSFVRQVLIQLEVEINEKMSSSVSSSQSDSSSSSSGEGQFDLPTVSTSEYQMNVLRDLKKLQALLMVPTNLKVLIVGDVMSEEDPVKPWLRGFLPPGCAKEISKGSKGCGNSSSSRQPGEFSSAGGLGHERPSDSRSLITPTSSLIANAKVKKEFHSVVSVPFLDHFAMVQAVPGPKSFDDPSLPALLVAIDVVTAEASRAHSDNYNYASKHYRSAVITCRPEQGFVFLQITDQDEIHRFYQTLFSIVCALVDRQNSAFSMLDLDSSRVSIANELAETEETRLLTMFQQTSSFIRGTAADYLKTTTKRILEISALEIREAARTFLLPLFTSTSHTAIAVCPEKSVEVQEAFSRLPHPLKATLCLDMTIHPETFMPPSNILSPSGSAEFVDKENRRRWLMSSSSSIGHWPSNNVLGILPSPPSICSDTESTCSSLDIALAQTGTERPSTVISRDLEVTGGTRRRRIPNESGYDENCVTTSLLPAPSAGIVEGDSIAGRAVGIGMMALGAAVAFTAFAVQSSSKNR